jgi:hypothetical protein
LATDQGLQIKIELTRQGKTQRWLVNELKERGLTTVDAQLLSKILKGKYPWKTGLVCEVIATANGILGIAEKTDAESA